MENKKKRSEFGCGLMLLGVIAQLLLVFIFACGCSFKKLKGYFSEAFSDPFIVGGIVALWIIFIIFFVWKPLKH